MIRLILSTVLFTMALSSQGFAQNEPARILIFYSSTGMGHLSAAQAIEQDIKDKDPSAVVELKNIRDFKLPIQEKLGTKLFWYVVKNYPDFYTKKYQEFIEKGNQAPSLMDMGAEYHSDDIIKYIEGFRPTTILSTHYGAALEISNLKGKGFFRNIKIGWLHTDYIQGFLPRLSKQLNMTFLAHPDLAETWKNEGVPPEKVDVSGMPVSKKIMGSSEEDLGAFRSKFLKSQGLDPDVTTIVISSGSEGVGDYPKMVQALSKLNLKRVQIITVCANNKENYKNLETLRSKLPESVSLTNLKFIPQDTLLGYVRSSDLYITKSGGLSPSEGFAINRPMILLDIYGGHEKENAVFFEKLGLALINRNYDDLTEQAQRVLDDEDLRNKMAQAQTVFRNSINIRRISDYALSSQSTTSLTVPAAVDTLELGVEGGKTVTGADEALAQLEKDSPADIEVLLSYGKFPEKLGTPVFKPLRKFQIINNLLANIPRSGFFDKEGNPFGHLAVRIGDQVYTVNGKAEPGVEKNLVHVSSLQDYLYSISRNYENEEHTDTFGEAYGRDLISFRVKGIPSAQLERMKSAAKDIDDNWRAGRIQWNKKEYNCADFVLALLKAGDFDPPSDVKRPTMPLDVFDGYVERFEQHFNGTMEFVLYSKVADSKNIYQISTFPNSINQVPRVFKNLFSKSLDVTEKRVTKRLASYPGDDRVYYENINNRSAEEVKIKETQLLTQLSSRKALVEGWEQDLLKLEAKQRDEDSTSSDIQKTLLSLSSTIDPKDILALKNGVSPAEIAKGDEIKARRLENFKEQFHKWLELETEQQNLYDAIASEELNILSEGMYWYSYTILDDLKLRLDKKEFEKFKNIFDQMEIQYNNYHKNNDQYGKPKDGVLRTMPYRAFFFLAKQFMTAVNTLKDPKAVSFIENLGQKTKAIKTLLSIAYVAFGEVFRAVGFKAGLTDNSTPTLGSIARISAAAGDALNIQVEVKGKENIPDISKNSSVVNVFAPTHRDPLLDFVIGGKLFKDLASNGDMLVFAAPDQFLPRKAANLMENVPSFIAVGRGSDKPIEKTLEQLKAGGPRSIFIYPEGSVSAGLGEFRPPRTKFASDLIPRLQGAGYKINLIPITYLDSARMPYEARVGSIFEGVPERLTVQIHKALPPESVEVLQGLGGNASINLFIRGQWNEALEKAGPEAKKRLTLKEAQERIETDLGFKGLLPSQCVETLSKLRRSY